MLQEVKMLQVYTKLQVHREVPLKVALHLFGHCPNSFRNPPPTHTHTLELQFQLQLPQTILASKCQIEIGKLFSKKGLQTIRARVETPPPLRAMPKCPQREFEECFPNTSYRKPSQ